MSLPHDYALAGEIECLSTDENRYDKALITRFIGYMQLHPGNVSVAMSQRQQLIFYFAPFGLSTGRNK